MPTPRRRAARRRAPAAGARHDRRAPSSRWPRADARVVARYQSFALVDAAGDDDRRLRAAGADRRDDMREVDHRGRRGRPRRRPRARWPASARPTAARCWRWSSSSGPRRTPGSSACARPARTIVTYKAAERLRRARERGRPWTGSRPRRDRSGGARGDPADRRRQGWRAGADADRARSRSRRSPARRRARARPARRAGALGAPATSARCEPSTVELDGRRGRAGARPRRGRDRADVAPEPQRRARAPDRRREPERVRCSRAARLPEPGSTARFPRPVRLRRSTSPTRASTTGAGPARPPRLLRAAASAANPDRSRLRGELHGRRRRPRLRRATAPTSPRSPPATTTGPAARQRGRAGLQVRARHRPAGRARAPRRSSTATATSTSPASSPATAHLERLRQRRAHLEQLLGTRTVGWAPTRATRSEYDALVRDAQPGHRRQPADGRGVRGRQRRRARRLERGYGSTPPRTRRRT